MDDGLGNLTTGDNLMLDYSDTNPIQLGPEDFDIDSWLSTFTNLQGAPEQLVSATQISNTNNLLSRPADISISSGIPTYGIAPPTAQDYTLTTGQDDLLSFIESFPFNPEQLQFDPYNIHSQLPEVGDVPSLSEPSPSSRDSRTEAPEIPEQSVILERYMNASSEDEFEVPFSAIEQHIQRLGSMSPTFPNSPVSLENTKFTGFEVQNTEYDRADTCSVQTNSSNVSYISRANCLQELGPLSIDEEKTMICGLPAYSRSASICSFRSSSSIASDACSVRTYSTTSTSSRAPSRRKRTMTNNHKLSRKSAKAENSFFCTFCGTSFSTKSTWKRHEESIHLMLKTWTCSPKGVMVSMSSNSVVKANSQKADSYKTCWFCSIDRDTPNVPFSFGQNHNLQTARDVPDRYTSMTCFSLEQHCFSHPNARTCHDNSLAEKTFIRFDHFARHLRDAHNIDGLKTTFEATHESPDDPLHGVFQVLPGPQHSRCGFCGETFSSWSDRIHHVSHEFWWKKRKMEEWNGDWGFDQEWMERLQDARLPEEFTSPLSVTNSTGADMEAKMQIDGIPRPGTPLLLAEQKPLVSPMSEVEKWQPLVLESGPLRDGMMEGRFTGRFPCTVTGCHKSFCLRKDLQRHHRTIHATEKPEYMCPVLECKRHSHGFSRKDNLKYHIMQLHINPEAPCFAQMQKILKTL
ncbi:hypothetical protein ABW20_dc0108798 [Dactylellina cionopaga]|nr:hypothetical protein ABW20_dc0108798 [Dactylellina cionopaga]